MVIPADLTFMNIKKSENVDKYLYVAIGLKKLKNMKMTVVLILVRVLEVYPKA